MSNNSQVKAKAAGITREQVAEAFDDLTESYEDDIDEAIAFAGLEHSFYIDVKRNHLLRLIAEHFSDLGRLDVLDLGCGLGAYHAGLENRFHELHGADLSAKSIALAAQKYPFGRYQSFVGARLPYPDARFDVVFTICVMHHVPPGQWQDFLSEMNRVLKPNGLALVFEHNPYNPATQYVVKSCDIDKDAVLLRPGRLRELFRSANFQHMKTKTIISLPPKGAVLSRLDSVLGHLPFGAQYYLSATKRAKD